MSSTPGYAARENSCLGVHNEVHYSSELRLQSLPPPHTLLFKARLKHTFEEVFALGILTSKPV